MASKDYGEYCGLARALELVGGRWTLLIVRELLTHTSRYTELLEDLPGIPTNVLSTRLKELEEAGIVERRVAPAPQRGIVYAATADGQQLEPAIIALARWGSTRQGDRQPGQIVPPSTLAMSLRGSFHRDEAAGLNASWEIRPADAVIYALVTDGQLQTGVGPVPGKPDLVIVIPADEVPSYRQILQAIKSGQAKLDGRTEMLDTFTRLFTPRAS